MNSAGASYSSAQGKIHFQRPPHSLCSPICSIKRGTIFY